jgi:hypothetical protein
MTADHNAPNRHQTRTIYLHGSKIPTNTTDNGPLLQVEAINKIKDHLMEVIPRRREVPKTTTSAS